MIQANLLQLRRTDTKTNRSQEMSKTDWQFRLIPAIRRDTYRMQKELCPTKPLSEIGKLVSERSQQLLSKPALQRARHGASMGYRFLSFLCRQWPASWSADRPIMDSCYRFWSFTLQPPTNRSLDKVIDADAGFLGGKETSTLGPTSPARIGVPGISKPISIPRPTDLSDNGRYTPTFDDKHFRRSQPAYSYWAGGLARIPIHCIVQHGRARSVASNVLSAFDLQLQILGGRALRVLPSASENIESRAESGPDI
jgi:hypothetical protein